jgi:hypothetical protein
MARTKLTFEERMARAAARLERAKAQFAQLEAREKDRDRKRRTRRHILLGAFISSLLEKDPARAAIIRDWCAADLPGFLRPEDLVLFDDLLEQRQQVR